jgi:hypothetical protein
MTHIVWLCVFAAGVALAQDASGPGSLATLEADARLKTASWEKLAQEMESSVSRLLPCDAKATATISAASKASEARLAAVAAYLQAAEQQASRETAAAQRALASAQALVTELATERSDVAQEQSGVDGELANLAESVKKRSTLADAQKVLQQIQTLTGQRAALAQGGQERQEAFLASVRNLVTAMGAREAALKEERIAEGAERGRWNAYYTARLARSQTECTIIRGTPAAPPRGPQGKQK